jgi:type IV pilus secretin PilQ/predicted competence protein
MDCFIDWEKSSSADRRAERAVSHAAIKLNVCLILMIFGIFLCPFLSEASSHDDFPYWMDHYEAGQKISLHLHNAPITEVLLGLSSMTGRHLVFSGNISGNVTANLENCSPEEALRAVIDAEGLSIVREGPVLVVFDSSKKHQNSTDMRIFRLSYADAKEVADSMKEALPSGKVSYNQSGNTIIVGGSPSAIIEAGSIIQALDIPEKQVKVEAEVIAVDRSRTKDLGIDWDFKSLTGSAHYERDQWSEAADGYENSRGRHSGRKSIEHTGWRVSGPDGYAGISYGRSITGHPYTFFFQARLNALITEGKAKILAKPHIVTMNGRKAEILIGSQIPVFSEHLNNGETSRTTEYKDAGIKLSYTPRISRNDDITANITAEISTPYLVPEMDAYRIVTRRANTLVRLKSGDCLTIGGLIDKEEEEGIRKVPILSKIPLLGKLFQSKYRSMKESEIVILIKAELL